MKNLLLVVPGTPTFLPAEKLAHNKPLGGKTSFIALAALFLSFFLSSIDSARAASDEVSPTPAAGSKSCGVYALGRLADLLKISPATAKQF
jgi:hypothetical protein